MRAEGGSMYEVRLNSAMLFLQGALLNFYTNGSLLFNNLDNMHYNYYNYVFDALEDFSLEYKGNVIMAAVLLVLMLVAALAMVAIWIYNVMHIDKKTFDIILWFLDIPVPYVVYLQNNCSTFLKSYVEGKELIDKGINFHDKNLYLDDYAITENEDDEINEENKSRKIMIARYKKKTFLSRCGLDYIQMFWLLFYAALLSVAYLAVLHVEQ